MLAIIVVTTLLYGAVHQAVIGLTYVLILILAILWSASLIRAKEVTLSNSTIQLVLLAAAVYGGIQVIPFGTVAAAGLDSIPSTISLDPFSTKVTALHFLALAIYFSISLSLFRSAKRIRRFAIFISVFGAAFAFFAILQSLLSPDKIYGLLERPYAQPFGSFVSRNNFAVWMEMAIAVPMGMLFTGSVEKEKRLVLIVALTLMGVSLVLSGSRGGLVVVLLQLGFLLLITYSRRERSSLWLKVALAGAVVVAIVAGTAFVGGESTLTRLSEEGLDDPQPSVNRPEIWGVTGRIISDNLLFGVGLGAYGVAYPKYDISSGLERVEQAHSDYLQVLSDAGIIGGLLGLVFLWFLFRYSLRAVRASNLVRRGIGTGAVTGLFGVLVHSLFDFGLHTTSIALLFLTMVAVVIASGSAFNDDTPQLRSKKST